MSCLLVLMYFLILMQMRLLVFIHLGNFIIIRLVAKGKKNMKCYLQWQVILLLLYQEQKQNNGLEQDTWAPAPGPPGSPLASEDISVRCLLRSSQLWMVGAVAVVQRPGDQPFCIANFLSDLVQTLWFSSFLSGGNNGVPEHG